MNSRERTNLAMNLEMPDRIPVMCQLAVGHYFLQSKVNSLDIWYTSEGFAEALIELQQRYDFDGILVNLPGRDPGYESLINNIEPGRGERTIRWSNGNHTMFPDDDNAHYYMADGNRYFPTFKEVKPEELYYVEPWDVTDITYPYTWGFEPEPRPFADFFPEYHLDTIKLVREKVGEQVSVHSEIFSPWSQFLELLNYEHALMAVLDDPGKVNACLDKLTEGAIDLAKKQASCNIDAVLISSAFAGAGLISRKHYETFVLPYEKRLISEVQKEYSVPIYTHTCGSIGDRLDLMVATGTNGIDTLDPPPLGTVELGDAKEFLRGDTFIKGNLDPVSTLLRGDTDSITKEIMQRIGIGKPEGGYILSSACSVSPHTPPENIELLAELAEEYGAY